MWSTTSFKTFLHNFELQHTSKYEISTRLIPKKWKNLKGLIAEHHTHTHKGLALLHSTRTGAGEIWHEANFGLMNDQGVSDESGAWHTLLDSWPLGCWPQALAAWAVLVCAPGYYSAPPAAVSALWAAASAPLAEGVQCEKPKSREKVNRYPPNNTTAK